MKTRVARWLTLASLVTLIGGTLACSGYGTASDPSAQLNFGVAMAQKGLWSEALFRFDKAVRMAPKNVRALNDLAVAEEALGQFDAALEHYQEALRLEPGNLALKRNYSRFIEFYQSFKPKAAESKATGSAASPPEKSSPAGAATGAGPGGMGGEGTPHA
ncbi:MAG TPA: tetratricopeptide repeat protein [Thermoanaerobaculia bacterium]|nr:tetratricopeptide repeat protein [Thermoanaerobaculia bacterium]